MFGSVIGPKLFTFIRGKSSLDIQRFRQTVPSFLHGNSATLLRLFVEANQSFSVSGIFSFLQGLYDGRMDILQKKIDGGQYLLEV